MMSNEVGVTFNTKKNKSNAYCCVFGCKSQACKNSNIRFHFFPKPDETVVVKNDFGDREMIDRRKKWIHVLKIGKKVTKYMQVCSLHFKKSDYFSSDSTSKKKYLKKDAFPSCNLPKSSNGNALNDTAKIARANRRLQRENKINQCTFEEDEFEDLPQPVHSTSINEDLTHPVRSSSINEDLPVPSTSNKNIDVGVQVQTDFFTVDFADLITTEKDLNTITGIISFNILNRIIELVKLGYPRYNSRNVRSLIIMFFTKLKHDTSYAILSLMFKLSKVGQCRKNILTMADVLYDIFTDAIYFPEKSEISKNMPLCFNNFLDTRIVLDCTEICIQKPKNVCCQIATYSHYKHTYTIKFMTGVTPGGVISYVSPMYGGRVSDNVIFEQSNIISRLEKHDAVMVDRGFTIDNLCKNNDIKLIRPPFLKDKLQFSEKEALVGAEIAKARVHVERVNQRLKMFKILSCRMPSGLVTKGDKIFTIICAIVNLSSPILKNDKF